MSEVLKVIAQHKNTSVEEVEKWASTVSKQSLSFLYRKITRGRKSVLGVGRPSNEASEKAMQLVKELVKSGTSQAEIERATGHSRQAIKRWCELMRISPVPGCPSKAPKERKE